MNHPKDNAYWTQEELDRRLQNVRDVLLEFLRERTRLDWFKHKVRWRLSRRYIWSAAAEDVSSMLEQAVEGNAGVVAFRKHLETRKRSIAEAIEKYNHSVRRHMEVEHGQPVEQFDAAAREELRQRRITFQGIRDELRRRAHALTPESGPDLIPEILSLRLAILTEDVRDQIFSEVAALVADEVSDSHGGLSQEEREILALGMELRMRFLDRCNAARLLAVNYAEARRFLQLDALLSWYRELVYQRQLEGAEPDANLAASSVILREVLQKSLDFLEATYPTSQGTHDRERASLRTADPPDDSSESKGA